MVALKYLVGFVVQNFDLNLAKSLLFVIEIVTLSRISTHLCGTNLRQNKPAKPAITRI